jgi:hypothetical protein
MRLNAGRWYPVESDYVTERYTDVCVCYWCDADADGNNDAVPQHRTVLRRYDQGRDFGINVVVVSAALRDRRRRYRYGYGNQTWRLAD